MAIASASVNSYRRLKPGFETPTSFFFSEANREAALRIPGYADTPESKRFEFEGQQLGVTMTFGIATFHKGETLEHCIARADTALYHGKEQGRNRVAVGKQPGLSLIG